MKRFIHHIRAHRHPLLLACMFLAACRREEPTTWDVGLAAPLARGRLDLSDLSDDSLFQADQEGLWHLILEEDLTDFDMDSLVEIPDTLIRRRFAVPLSGGPWYLPPGTPLITLSEDRYLSLPDVELKQIRMKGGVLRYTLRNYVQGDISCTYALPGLQLAGTGTVISEALPAATSQGPSVAEGFIPLNGYTLDLTGSSGYDRNAISSQLSVTTSPDAGGDAVVYGQDSVVIELEFADASVAYARGYFGMHRHDVQETVHLQTGLEIPGGVLALDQVEVVFRAENYTGVDAAITLYELSGSNPNTGSLVELDQSGLFSVMQLERALDQGGVVTPTVETHVINSGNSNINSFLENLPDGLSLAAEIEINPLGDVSDGNDFIYTDQAIRAWVRADIPLRFGMDDLVLRDTLEVEADLDVNAGGHLYLHITNRFPVSASLVAHLLDADGQFSRALLQNRLVEPATPTGDPAHPLPVATRLEIPFDASDLGVLEAGGRIALRAELNTPSFPAYVGLYTTHYMDFVLTTDASVEIHVE